MGSIRRSDEEEEFYRQHAEFTAALIRELISRLGTNEAAADELVREARAGNALFLRRYGIEVGRRENPVQALLRSVQQPGP